MGGEVVSTHTSYVAGGKAFAARLAALGSVKRVRVGPLTGRRSSRQKVNIRQTSTSVEVELGTTDGHQVFYAFPVSGTELGSLEMAVRAMVEPNDGPAEEQELESPQRAPNVTEVASENTGEEDSVAEPPPPTTVAPQPQCAHASIVVCGLFKLTSEEARALIAEFGSGFPHELSTGARTRLGNDVWGALKRHGFIETAGVGRGTIAGPIHTKFEETRFVAFNRTRRFKERYASIPPEHRFPREPGGWLNDLREQMGIRIPLESERRVGNPPTPSGDGKNGNGAAGNEYAVSAETRADSMDAADARSVADPDALITPTNSGGWAELLAEQGCRSVEAHAAAEREAKILALMHKVNDVLTECDDPGIRAVVLKRMARLAPKP